MVKRFQRITVRPEAKPVTKNAKKAQNATKLRGSITPGTVVIAVAGQFKGSRVVVLKQLASGLLLVSGPYSLNGCPLRRMNQRYVIATSTKVDVSKVNSSKINDAYFQRTKEEKKSGKEAFLNGESKAPLSAAKKADQKAVDTAILAGLDATTKKYLKAKFALSSNMNAHELKF